MTKLHEVVEKNELVKIIIASSSPIKRKVGSELIKFYQGTKYSHVLVIVNDVVFQASHGRVNTFHLDEFLKENKIIDQIEVCKEFCDFEFLFSTLGRRYGFIQLLKISLKFITLTKLKIIRTFKYRDNGSKYLICSEYVGRFLKIPWVNDLTDPEDIISHLVKITKNNEN